MDNLNKVDHPAHYTKGSVEVIDLIDFTTNRISKIANPMCVAVYIGNAVKYISRAPYKDNELEDCKKAAWYLHRAVRVGSHLTTYFTAPEANWFEMATSHLEVWQQNILFYLATNQWKMATIGLSQVIAKHG